VLLHHIRGHEVGGDLTCIAWNPAAEDPFMFGTGSHDGAVRIWSSPPSSQNEQDQQQYGSTIPDIVTEDSSTFDSDVEYDRTDSPVHLEADLPQAQHSENEGGSRERTIAFAAP
jgi:WD repeat-containing protein 26